MSRTRVRQWTPGFREALKLAWKPLATYALFTVSAFIALMLAILDSHRASGETGKIGLICLGGLAGVGVGQVVALKRLKTAPAIAVAALLISLSFALLGQGPFFETVLPAVAFFVMAIPCGILSLQHRYELLAAFWPAVGWIGAVIVMLEEQQRLNDWNQDKVKVWTPQTVAILAGFVITLMVYLAAKQTMRVELWQALSGATERRISRRTTLAAVPRKNLLPLLGLALALTGVVAVLAPYLWRTGPGKDGGGGGEPSDNPDGDGPRIDGDALARTLQQMAQASLAALEHLWPLLLLFVFYRPLKRFLLLRHLRKPFVPTPPSERIDNLWEYVRIAAEDAGVVTLPADSVEELVARIRENRPAAASLDGPLDRAAAIYTTTRYGFVIESGAAARMQVEAETVAHQLRATLGFGKRLLNGWRALT
jgi:hypothetical protein